MPPIFEVRNGPCCDTFHFRGTWAECAKAIQKWHDDLPDIYEDIEGIWPKIYEISVNERCPPNIEVGREIAGFYKGSKEFEYIIKRIN